VDGFVAGGVESVRYGERWVQRLTRNSELVTIHVQHTDDAAE
jgi:cell division protein FtsX